ncbi:hypothetical protein BDK51DRAFT_30706 [Blyttiomyces helicus]|uniref:RRM Nup35-type domain-containing protein n=1 Tax=Blyttiomyces helicus TaxID=388810 RepID=A0A4P9WGY8_9FUNG|nr:hypothetical protein BDK51DRAFT_30706 [Blyttiomyces helicus]|eukprot:RKO91103.1 hypothetical protein BDK51DRAFT_30706 [Blyttiomyces helicus]
MFSSPVHSPFPAPNQRDPYPYGSPPHRSLTPTPSGTPPSQSLFQATSSYGSYPYGSSPPGHGYYNHHHNQQQQQQQHQQQHQQQQQQQDDEPAFLPSLLLDTLASNSPARRSASRSPSNGGAWPSRGVPARSRSRSRSPSVSYRMSGTPGAGDSPYGSPRGGSFGGGGSAGGMMDDAPPMAELGFFAPAATAASVHPEPASMYPPFDDIGSPLPASPSPGVFGRPAVSAAAQAADAEARTLTINGFDPVESSAVVAHFLTYGDVTALVAPDDQNYAVIRYVNHASVQAALQNLGMIWGKHPLGIIKGDIWGKAPPERRDATGRLSVVTPVRPHNVSTQSFSYSASGPSTPRSKPIRFAADPIASTPIIPQKKDAAWTPMPFASPVSPRTAAAPADKAQSPVDKPATAVGLTEDDNAMRKASWLESMWGYALGRIMP